MGKIEPVIIVHGGAGFVPDEKKPKSIDGVRSAARIGYKKFKETGNIMEGVIRAVEYLEDDENFNAGRGSVLTEDGTIELEALVMDGQTLAAGAITGVHNILHPVQVAALVKDKTPHVLIGGKHANIFAEKHNIPLVNDSELYTDVAHNRLQDFLKKKKNETKPGETVGAIGIDKSGHVVACSSTGGVTGKMCGRVGDTPIPGAGSYADNELGVVTTTGMGDAILRYNLSTRILYEIKYGKDAQAATENEVTQMTKRTGGTAGAITLSKTGDIGVAFSSKRMPWAYQKANKLHYGVDHGEDNEEEA